MWQTKDEMKYENVKWKMWWYEEDFKCIIKLTRIQWIHVSIQWIHVIIQYGVKLTFVLHNQTIHLQLPITSQIQADTSRTTSYHRYPNPKSQSHPQPRIQSRTRTEANPRKLNIERQPDSIWNLRCRIHGCMKQADSRQQHRCGVTQLHDRHRTTATPTAAEPESKRVGDHVN